MRGLRRRAELRAYAGKQRTLAYVAQLTCSGAAFAAVFCGEPEVIGCVQVEIKAVIQRERRVTEFATEPGEALRLQPLAVAPSSAARSKK